MQQANYLQLFLNVGLKGPVIFLLHLPAPLLYSRYTVRALYLWGISQTFHLQCPAVHFHSWEKCNWVL